MAKYATSDGWHQIKATAQAAEVTADLSNFVVYFDLSEFPADFWDNVEDDGGSIRVLKGDLDTEIAREVVSCNKSAQTGEVHARADGTLSAASDTEFWFAFGKDGETDYAVDATFGQYAVWKGVGSDNADFTLVCHGGGAKDSTENGYNGVDSGGISSGDTTGKISTATTYNANTGDYIDFSSHSDAFDALFAGGVIIFTAWMQYASTTESPVGIFNINGNDFVVGSGGDNTGLSLVDGGAWLRQYGSFDETDGWTHIEGKLSRDVFINGSSVVNSGGTGTANDSGKYTYGKSEWGFLDGVLDECRCIGLDLSTGWTATEYNNQNDPAAFWTVSDYQGPAAVVESGMVSPILLSPVKLHQVQIGK